MPALPARALPGRPDRHLAALGLAVAVALGTGACSGDDAAAPAPSATPGGASSSPAPRQEGPITEVSGVEVVARVREAVEAEDSVRLAGTVVSGGDAVGIDARLSRDSGSAGTLDLAGDPIEVVTLADGTNFVRSPQLLEGFGVPPGAAAPFEDRFVQVPSDSGAPGLEFSAFVDDLLREASRAETGDVVDDDGTRVLQVRGLGSDAVLLVPVEGPPLPRAIVGEGGTSGRADFSEWGEPVDVLAPADPVTLQELQELLQATLPSASPGAPGPTPGSVGPTPPPEG